MHHEGIGDLEVVDRRLSPSDEGVVVVRYPIEDKETGGKTDKVSLSVASGGELITVVMDKNEWDELTAFE